LSKKNVDDIVMDLDRWSEPKVTWATVASRAKTVISRPISRQSLEANDRIYLAYKKAKDRLRKGLPLEKRKPLAERMEIVRAENDRLRAQNDVLLEMFVTWLHNARRRNVTIDELDEPLVAARDASDIAERELRRRAEKKAEQREHQTVREARRRGPPVGHP
jgi:hypothetical protein